MGYLDQARKHSKAARKHYKSGPLTEETALESANEHCEAAGYYAVSEGKNVRAGLPRNNKHHAKIFHHMSWMKSLQAWVGKQKE